MRPSLRDQITPRSVFLTTGCWLPSAGGGPLGGPEPPMRACAAKVPAPSAWGNAHQPIGGIAGVPAGGGVRCLHGERLSFLRPEAQGDTAC